jgi:hypothetical protein
MHLSLGQLEQNVVQTLYTMSTNLVTFPHGHPNSYDGPKGEVLHLHIETSRFAGLQSLRVFYFILIGQSKWVVVLINS